jgi:hypothetical protein
MFTVRMLCCVFYHEYVICYIMKLFYIACSANIIDVKLCLSKVHAYIFHLMQNILSVSESS